MRYFDLAGKAKIKISSVNITTEDVKKQAIETGIVSQNEIDLIREINSEEFLSPNVIENKCNYVPKSIVCPEVKKEKEDDLNIDHLPSWQEIIDELRIKSTKPDYSPKIRKKR